MNKLLFLLTYFFTQGLSQPCSAPVVVTSSPIQGSCLVDNAVTFQYTSAVLGTLNGLSTFMITLWFRPDLKQSGRGEQALFRVTADSSDVKPDTANGVRLGMFFTADLDQSTTIRIQYAKPSAIKQEFLQALPYVDQKWIFAAAGLDYTNVMINKKKFLKGIIAYYAWQPFAPSTTAVNPQPVQESINFNTPLTSISQLELLYWGDYKRFCGSIDRVRWYPGYIELGYKHNWINLAFFSDTYSYQVAGYFKLEDQSGQLLRDATTINTAGVLGSTNTVEASADPTFTVDNIQFTSGQYATLPAVSFTSINKAFGLNFWFKTNAIINSDGDNGDLTKDLVLIKRLYQGTGDVFGLMFYQASANQYGTKIKLHGILYTLPVIVHTVNVWHFIGVRVAYTNAVNELSKIMFDVVMEGSLMQAHQITTQTNTYLESLTDTIILGSSKNGFSGTLWMSHVQFYTSYTSFIDEDITDAIPLSCNLDCEISLNTPVYSQCILCTNSKFLNDGLCITNCIAGPTALTNGQIDVCKSCDYKCATCLTNSDCSSCNLGFYLQTDNKSCVLSASCLGGTIGEPSTSLCVYCGNGNHDGLEECDDKNFISQDGCTNCTIDNDYVCDGSQPDLCQFRCGDGVVDVGFGEQCDDNNYIDGDGCTECLIDAKYTCTGAPSICILLCGNGVRFGIEQCDDGNVTDFDGCSSTCTVEPGYECAGVSPDSCTKLCGNGIVNFGEECDDGNTKSGDGCSDCVVDRGWVCQLSICQQVCGNGKKDQDEDCDDGNQINGDGCSKCNVDKDYVCTGGSLTSQDICKMIPDICGDGIKKSTEKCDDGNTKNDDGCSKTCQVEVGFYCDGGSQYAKDQCFEICGDGRRIGKEICDDGNLFGGDGCNEQCVVENLYQCNGGTAAQPDKCSKSCGNGILDPEEECDDENPDSGDGCSSECRIESGWGCNIIEGGQRYQCFKCVTGCAICTNNNAKDCTTCYSGLFLLIESNRCEAGCPFGFMVNYEQRTCDACSEGCERCNIDVKLGQQCQRCQYNYFLMGGKCTQKCPEGYYNQLNVITGNVCAKCKEPCAVCSSENECSVCGDGTFMDESGKCVDCGLGKQCLKCDPIAKVCLHCRYGFYRTEIDGGCAEIIQVCGDGLHHPLETCDDGNIEEGDGCTSDCRVENSWGCILEDQQGPDICYQQAPPNITTYFSDVRPLQPGINFTNITSITIPTIDINMSLLQEPPDINGTIVLHDKSKLYIPYEYTISQIDQQTVLVQFDYRVTISGLYVIINITKPELVLDKFNWTLAGEQSKIKKLQNTRLLLPTIQSINKTDDNPYFKNYLEVEGVLQYFIYYDENEQLIYEIISWGVLIVSLVGVCSGLVYFNLIGEGRNWKMLEIIQIISTLRFVNWRYSKNLELVFLKLDYFNGAFMFNLFTIFIEEDQELTEKDPVKFQILNYCGQFLLGGGGRFISWLAYTIVFLLLNQLIYRIVRIDTIEYYTEKIQQAFTFQGFIKFVEILFIDLMLSTILQFRNMDLNHQHQYKQLHVGIAILITTILTILFVLIVWKFILNNKLQKIQGFYDKVGVLFDGISFDSPFTKSNRNFFLVLLLVFTIVPYIQKVVIVSVLVCVNEPFTQITVICFIRLVPFSVLYFQIPFYYIEFVFREIVYESLLIIMAISTISYLDYYSSKESKLTNGWGLMSILVALALIQCVWVKYAYSIIEKMTPPSIPEHEEAHVTPIAYNNLKQEERESEEDIYIKPKPKEKVVDKKIEDNDKKKTRLKAKDGIKQKQQESVKGKVEEEEQLQKVEEPKINKKPITQLQQARQMQRMEDDFFNGM